MISFITLIVSLIILYIVGKEKVVNWFEKIKNIFKLWQK